MKCEQKKKRKDFLKGIKEALTRLLKVLVLFLCIFW